MSYILICGSVGSYSVEVERKHEFVLLFRRQEDGEPKMLLLFPDNGLVFPYHPTRSPEKGWRLRIPIALKKVRSPCPSSLPHLPLHPLFLFSPSAGIYFAKLLFAKPPYQHNDTQKSQTRPSASMKPLSSGGD